MAPRVRLELTTLRLTAACSTNWANEEYKTGDFLFSQRGNPQVSSALRSLTSVFGMGTGISSSSLSPENFVLLLDFLSYSSFTAYQLFLIRNTQKYIDKYLLLFISLLLGKTLWLSPRSISTGQLHVSLHFHLQPIYQVVFLESYYLSIWDIVS